MCMCVCVDTLGVLLHLLQPPTGGGGRRKGGCSLKTPLKLWPNQLAPKAGLPQLPDRQTDPQTYRIIILYHPSFSSSPPPPLPATQRRAWPCPCKDLSPSFSPEIKQVRLRFKKSVGCCCCPSLIHSSCLVYLALSPHTHTYTHSHMQTYCK